MGWRGEEAGSQILGLTVLLLVLVPTLGQGLRGHGFAKYFIAQGTGSSSGCTIHFFDSCCLGRVASCRSPRRWLSTVESSVGRTITALSGKREGLEKVGGRGPLLQATVRHCSGCSGSSRVPATPRTAGNSACVASTKPVALVLALVSVSVACLCSGPFGSTSRAIMSKCLRSSNVAGSASARCPCAKTIEIVHSPPSSQSLAISLP